MYNLVRRILFIFPPEWTHYFSMNCLRLLCSIGITRKLIAVAFQGKSTGDSQWSLGELSLKNPVGLGAGFDKNAKYLRGLEALGFGFVEIGTVTPLPQAGNDKPRLFRLPKDSALINRMGFNNDGVKVIGERLKKWRDCQPPTANCQLIIGGNIGKNKITPNEDAWKDYEICFKELHPYVDYFVVNVSSPNTPGLRELQEKESLRKILMHLQMINNAKATAKPIFLKIAPDLTKEQIDDVIDLSMEIKLDGLVATNTTINRSQLTTHHSQLTSIGAGGLSGKPLRERSTEIVRYISEKTNGQLPVIASGGIFTSEDAKEKLTAGAILVQVWTGFIYEGPGIVRKICKQL
ncbi:MAG: quinone-dependent dihydroorotate dehydrogenase [Chitinophagaceae bacterium]